MKTVYLYLMDTMADWEVGFVAAELTSKRFFKKDAPEVELKRVALTTDPICSMGGMRIIPEITLKDLEISSENMLILPGSFSWDDPKHSEILDFAKKLLEAEGTVCAICGATTAVAACGLLDARPHTSNGAGFLEMMCPSYKGTEHYVDELAVADGNLITASSAGSLMFTKYILARLGVMKEETLEAWFLYFRTGEAAHFWAMMQSLQD